VRFVCCATARVAHCVRSVSPSSKYVLTRSATHVLQFCAALMSKRGLEEHFDPPEAKKARQADEANTMHMYQPCAALPALASKVNSLVEVLLPAKFLTSDLKSVKLCRLWGTDVYTDDSDLVAVLVHTGHVKLKQAAPKLPLLVSLRVCPPQQSYTGTERNGLKSRSWTKEHCSVSYKIERCLQHTAGSVLAPELSLLRPGTSRQIPGSIYPQLAGPGQSFVVPPSASSVVFNLSNEPCYKYSLSLIADQGTQPDRWTSGRLRREVFYLESHHRRFELALTGQRKGTDGYEYDMYNFSQVMRPHEMDRREMEAAGVPLPAEHVKVMHADVDWEEFVWGPCFLRCRGVEYPLVSTLFMPHTVASS